MSAAVTHEALKDAEAPVVASGEQRPAGRRLITLHRARRFVHNLLVVFMGAFLAAYPFVELAAVDATGGSGEHALEWAFVAVAGLIAILLFWLEGRK